MDGTVYIGSDRKTVYALDATNRTEQWRYETGGMVHSSVVMDGTVYVRSSDEYVYALEWYWESAVAVQAGCNCGLVTSGSSDTVYVGVLAMSSVR
jgi:FOG: WD40-like repeat